MITEDRILRMIALERNDDRWRRKGKFAYELLDHMRSKYFTEDDAQDREL